MEEHSFLGLFSGYLTASNMSIVSSGLLSTLLEALELLCLWEKQCSKCTYTYIYIHKGLWLTILRCAGSVHFYFSFGLSTIQHKISEESRMNVYCWSFLNWHHTLISRGTIFQFTHTSCRLLTAHMKYNSQETEKHSHTHSHTYTLCKDCPTGSVELSHTCKRNNGVPWWTEAFTKHMWRSYFMQKKPLPAYCFFEQ